MKSIKLKKILNRLLFGEKRRGEKIYEKEISFRTFDGNVSLDFNEWCRQTQVSSAYINDTKNETN